MAEITEQGFVSRTRDDIIIEISTRLKTAFGDQFDTTPESPDGQLIGIFADSIYNAEMAAQAAYQSSDPDSAKGVSLEYVSEYNGVFRQLQTPTTGTVIPTGNNGTVIPKGSVVSDGSVQFTTDRQTVIPNAVGVTCTELGRIVVPANSITEIITPIAGWAGVNNPNETTTGLDRESDAQLRNRRARSTINSGSNTIESIYASLNRLGVEFSAVEQNEENISVRGVPPKSFHTVVAGGNDEDVARAIYSNKPAGIKAYGTTTVRVKDSKGYSHKIGFSRPQDTRIQVSIQFKRLEGASRDIENNIKDSIVNYINKLEIGSDVIWSQLLSVASNAGAAIRVFNIRRVGGSFSTNDISIPIEQKAVISSNDITVSEV